MYTNYVSFLPYQFFYCVISEIKNLWPGTMFVTGKPSHSEFNGGVEQENRTEEEKVSCYIHEKIHTLVSSSTIHSEAL